MSKLYGLDFKNFKQSLLWNFQNSNSDYIDNHKNGPGHKKLNYQIDSNNL